MMGASRGGAVSRHLSVIGSTCCKNKTGDPYSYVLKARPPPVPGEVGIIAASATCASHFRMASEKRSRIRRPRPSRSTGT